MILISEWLSGGVVKGSPLVEISLEFPSFSKLVQVLEFPFACCFLVYIIYLPREIIMCLLSLYFMGALSFFHLGFVHAFFVGRRCKTWIICCGGLWGGRINKIFRGIEFSTLILIYFWCFTGRCWQRPGSALAQEERRSSSTIDDCAGPVHLYINVFKDRDALLKNFEPIKLIRFFRQFKLVSFFQCKLDCTRIGTSFGGWKWDKTKVNEICWISFSIERNYQSELLYGLMFCWYDRMPLSFR